jgi:hypothetical protein
MPFIERNAHQNSRWRRSKNEVCGTDAIFAVPDCCPMNSVKHCLLTSCIACIYTCRLGMILESEWMHSLAKHPQKEFAVLVEFGQEHLRSARPGQSGITSNTAMHCSRESLHFVGLAISACLLPSSPRPTCTADSSIQQYTAYESGSS